MHIHFSGNVHLWGEPAREDGLTANQSLTGILGSTVGASLLAKNLQTTHTSRQRASSLTSIASRLAPTEKLMGVHPKPKKKPRKSGAIRGAAVMLWEVMLSDVYPPRGKLCLPIA
ncbi:hypothetical protein D3C78_1465430 [compost metagenome]